LSWLPPQEQKPADLRESLMRRFMAQGRESGRGAKAFATLALLFASTLALGQSARQGELREGGRGRSISPELATLMARAHGKQTANQPVEVIVQYRNTPTASQLNRAAKLGTAGASKLNLIRGGLIKLPLSSVQALANDPEVRYVTPNRSLRGADDYAEDTIGADIAQSAGWDGSGITVAVIDSGIHSSQDLNDSSGQSRVVYNQSFVPGTDTDDHYGHGTHVAGIIAGNGKASGGKSNSKRIAGVAPNVRLVNLKVLDSDGQGRDSYVIAALQRAIALKSTYNIRVINLSLGRPIYESYEDDPLCQAVEAAWQAGIVVVVAAGNDGRNDDYHTDGYATIASPANDPYVITVGAMNTNNTASTADDKIASYSSKGPTLLDHVVKPDLVAPGNQIASLLVPNSTLDLDFKSNEVSPTDYGSTSTSAKAYFKLSGTSMATPMVSAAAALLLHKNPSLSPDTIKARLMKTANKIFPSYSQMWLNGRNHVYQYDIFTVGAGYLDIPDALSNSDVVTGNALSPVAVRKSGAIYLVADSASVWSNSVIWGSSVVWGNALLAGSSVIWGNSVVWGNNSLDGCSVVWGNSVVWGGVRATDAGNDALSIDGNGDDIQQ
jgi:serine protease AprX